MKIIQIIIIIIIIIIIRVTAELRNTIIRTKAIIQHKLQTKWETSEPMKPPRTVKLIQIRTNRKLLQNNKLVK